MALEEEAGQAEQMAMGRAVEAVAAAKGQAKAVDEAAVAAAATAATDAEAAGAEEGASEECECPGWGRARRS